MVEDTRHAAVVASLKATASVLHARPLTERNEDWADLMAANLAAAGLLAPPPQPNETMRDVVAVAPADDEAMVLPGKPWVIDALNVAHHAGRYREPYDPFAAADELLGRPGVKRSVPEHIWQAVYDVIRALPVDVESNARTWRAVYAVLRAAGFDVDEVLLAADDEPLADTEASDG
jgi:hypothetical protein